MTIRWYALAQLLYPGMAMAARRCNLRGRREALRAAVAGSAP